MLLEYVTLKKMREIIGWPEGRGDGIFSPGTCAAASAPPSVLQMEEALPLFGCVNVHFDDLNGTHFRANYHKIIFLFQLNLIFLKTSCDRSVKLK